MSILVALFRLSTGGGLRDEPMDTSPVGCFRFLVLRVVGAGTEFSFVFEGVSVSNGGGSWDTTTDTAGVTFGSLESGGGKSAGCLSCCSFSLDNAGVEIGAFFFFLALEAELLGDLVGRKAGRFRL